MERARRTAEIRHMDLKSLEPASETVRTQAASIARGRIMIKIGGTQ